MGEKLAGNWDKKKKIFSGFCQLEKKKMSFHNSGTKVMKIPTLSCFYSSFFTFYVYLKHILKSLGKDSILNLKDYGDLMKSRLKLRPIVTLRNVSKSA